MIQLSELPELFDKIIKKPEIAKNLTEIDSLLLINHCEEIIRKVRTLESEKVISVTNEGEHWKMKLIEYNYPDDVFTVDEKVDYWSAKVPDYNKAKLILSLFKPEEKKPELQTIFYDENYFWEIILFLGKDGFVKNGNWCRKSYELSLLLAKLVISGHLNIDDQREIARIAVETFNAQYEVETIRKEISTRLKELKNNSLKGSDPFKYIKVHESTR